MRVRSLAFAHKLCQVVFSSLPLVFMTTLLLWAMFMTALVMRRRWLSGGCSLPIPSLGQLAEQWPHSPVPVTWLPLSSTRVLHQNLPWVQKRFESKKSLGFQTSGSRSVIQLDLRVPPNRKGKTQGLPWPGPPGQLGFSQDNGWQTILKTPINIKKKTLSEFLKQDWLWENEICCLVRCCKYSKEQFLK